MATRSTISIKTPEGKYHKIYCHWDGYPSNNGRILKEHYTDVDKINKLIDLGDISSLSENVEPTGDHSYDNPQKGVVVAYGRDRGEDGVGFKVFDSLEELSKHSEEYDYVWDDGWKLLARGELREFDPDEENEED
jgi:hypothetical protein